MFLCASAYICSWGSQWSELLQLLFFAEPGLHRFCLVGCRCSALFLLSSPGTDWLQGFLSRCWDPNWGAQACAPGTMLGFVLLNQVLFLLGAVFIDSCTSSLRRVEASPLSCLVVVASQLALHFSFWWNVTVLSWVAEPDMCGSPPFLPLERPSMCVYIFTEKCYKHPASLEKRIL